MLVSIIVVTSMVVGSGVGVGVVVGAGLQVPQVFLHKVNLYNAKSHTRLSQVDNLSLHPKRCIESF